MLKRMSLIFMLIMFGIFTISAFSFAKEVQQDWELVNPAGVVSVKSIKPAPRILSLDGKTVVLRWNSKHNGDVFLNRVAELLKQNVPTAKVIKLYEVDKSTVTISGSVAESVRIAKIIENLEADIVIASQAD
jgi:hypothetical protein